jgi:hypothetical protein
MDFVGMRLLSKPTARPEIKPAMLNVHIVRLRFSARSRTARYGFERSLLTIHF